MIRRKFRAWQSLVFNQVCVLWKFKELVWNQHIVVQNMVERPFEGDRVVGILRLHLVARKKFSFWRLVVTVIG